MPWSILCCIILSMSYSLCFVAFFLKMFLSFVWASFSHSCYTPHASSFTLVHIFFSFLFLLPLDSFVYSWQKGGEYTREYTSVYRHFYIIHVHNLRGRKHLLWKNLVLLCFTLCLFFCCFMVFLVIFSIYALLFSSHCVYVLDMHTSLCYYALLITYSDDHLLYYVIIVVISIWLFSVWSSCSYVSHLVYLIDF